MKSKILILTPLIPYPLDEGGKISQYAFLEYLQYHMHISLILVANNKQEENYIDELKVKLPKVNIEYFKNFKEISKIEIPKKQITKKQKLKLIYYKIYDFIYPPKKVEKSVITHAKENEKLTVPFNFNELNRNIINFITEKIDLIQPDLIQIEHNSFLVYFYAIPQKYKTIFVEHEIQFERFAKHLEIYKSSYDKYVYNSSKDLEILLLNNASMILTFSEEDKQKLIENKITTLIESSAFPVLDSAFEKPENFSVEKLVFIGAESHFPNKDALDWYLTTIAEKIYHETNLKLHIIGKWSVEYKNKYSSEYIIFEGYVDDLKEICRNSIMIVPLRIGSGIRTKIMYGMTQGIPIVSTSIGCEGLGIIDNENILVADDIDMFKNQIIKLYNDKLLCKKLSENAYNFIKNNFSQEFLGNKRLEFYNKLLNN